MKRSRDRDSEDINSAKQYGVLDLLRSDCAELILPSSHMHELYKHAHGSSLESDPMIDFTNSSYLKLLGVPIATCSLVSLAYHASQGYHERNRHTHHIKLSNISGWHVLRAIAALVLLGVTVTGIAGDWDIHGVLLCIVTVSDSTPRETSIDGEYRDMVHY